MFFIGCFSAFLIGVVMGLLGSGGSILIIPVLVYVLGISPELSTAYSLFVVGSSALVGAFMYYRKGELSLQTALVFSVPSLLAVFATRRYVMPRIPEELGVFAGLPLSKGLLIMLLFAVLMIAASVPMIKTRKKPLVLEDVTGSSLKFNYPLILIEGLVVGVLTGFVGAGGGFLIIPALVMLSGLSMKLAVGTSLLIIAIKSLLGFLGDIGVGTPIDWSFMLGITAFTLVGVFVGSIFSVKISGEKLKFAFGWFVLLMGAFILLKELFT